MTYTATTWNDGDVITKEKLNKLEQGVQNEQVGPQGPAGTNGADGAAAGFGTPTATVDANTGTPSVEVTTSGPDTAKVFNFAFKNLKGAKGDAGAKGDKGDKGDTGATGPTGADGKSITAIELTTTEGQVTGGTATLSDESTIPITVTASEGA